MKTDLGNLDVKKLAATGLRVICGAILIYASQDKLGDPAKFSKVVENYHVLPLTLIPLAAVVIPWLEFFTGVCLMTGFRTRSSALLFCALMAVYSFSLGLNLLKGVEMNCGCFSMDSTEKITGWTVLRDLVFLSLGLWVLRFSQTYAALDSLLNLKKNA